MDIGFLKNFANVIIADVAMDPEPMSSEPGIFAVLGVATLVVLAVVSSIVIIRKIKKDK